MSERDKERCISIRDLKIQKFIDGLIDRALEEDGAWFDLTSLGLPNHDKKAKAKILAKEELIVAGVDIAARTFYRLAGAPIDWTTKIGDGEKAEANKTIAQLDTDAWIILAGERTALNFLQRLSGISTLTKKYVERIAGSRAKIVDTRKTTPCLRILEKYAVCCGGGYNHRLGLDKGCLIKDNHIHHAGGIRPAVESIREAIPHMWKIEVEVETLEQVKECLDLGVHAVLLDNMSIPNIANTVEMVNGRMLVEASGKINLENIGPIARTGVDLISIGALTHSAQAVDISLEFV